VAGRVTPRASAAATYLITDEGTKFPVVSADALRSLGYGGVRPASVSPALLAMLPTGPALDPAAAQAVVRAGSAS
jgi:hypothetical protein